MAYSDVIAFRPIGMPDLNPSAKLVMDASAKANPMSIFSNIGDALGNFQLSRATDLDYQTALSKAQQQIIERQKALDPELWLSDPANAAKYEELRSLATQGLEQSNQARQELRALGLPPHVMTALDDTLKYLKAGDESRKDKAATTASLASAKASEASAALHRIQAESAQIKLTEDKANKDIDEFMSRVENRQVMSGIIDLSYAGLDGYNGKTGPLQAAQRLKEVSGSPLSLKALSDKITAFRELGKPDTKTIDTEINSAIKAAQGSVERIGKQEFGPGLGLTKAEAAKIYWGDTSPTYNGASLEEGKEISENKKGNTKTATTLLGDEQAIQRGISLLTAKVLEKHPNIDIAELSNVLRHIVIQNAKPDKWYHFESIGGNYRLNEEVRLDMDNAIQDVTNWHNALEANREYFEFFHPTNGFLPRFKEELGKHRTAFVDKFNPFKEYKIKNNKDFENYVLKPTEQRLSGAFNLKYNSTSGPKFGLEPIFSTINGHTSGKSNDFSNVKAYASKTPTPKDNTLGLEIPPHIKEEALQFYADPTKAPRVLPEMIEALTPKQLQNLQQRSDVSEMQRIQIEAGIINKTKKEKEAFKNLLWKKKPLQAYDLLASPDSFINIDDIVNEGKMRSRPLLRELAQQLATKLYSKKLSTAEAQRYTKALEEVQRLINQYNASLSKWSLGLLNQ